MQSGDTFSEAALRCRWEGVELAADGATLSEAEGYCRYAAREREKVDRFWGSTWSAPIRIHVSESYRISKALLPAHFGNRGFIEMPLARARDSTAAFLHEMVHVYAPNRNRFLAEGLAVYLHSKLAGNPASPNFGEHLGRLARALLSSVDSLGPLSEVQTPRPLSSVMEGKAAYIVAGSFVGFLIEICGMQRFRGLYETGDYERSMGRPLQALEDEWRSSLPGNRA
jgi:hypothetical protein